MDEIIQQIWELEKTDNDFNFASLNSVSSFEWELEPINHDLVSDLVLPDNNKFGDIPEYHWNDYLEPVESVPVESGKVSTKSDTPEYHQNDNLKPVEAVPVESEKVSTKSDTPEYHQNNNLEPVEAVPVESEKVSTKSDTPEYHRNDNLEPVEAVPVESEKVSNNSVRSNKRTSETKSNTKKPSSAKEGSKKKRARCNEKRECNCSTRDLVSMDDLKKFSESLLQDLRVESENMLANFREDLKKLADTNSTKKDKHKMKTGQAQQPNITASEPQLEHQWNDLSVRNCIRPAGLAANDTRLTANVAANITGLAANATVLPANVAANVTGQAANATVLPANVAANIRGLAANATVLPSNVAANVTGHAANATVLSSNVAANITGLAANATVLPANIMGLAANATVLPANIMGLAANATVLPANVAANVTGVAANGTRLNYARQSSAMDAINHHGYISNTQAQVAYPNFVQMGSNSSYLYPHSIQTSSMGSGFPLTLHQRLNNFSYIPSQTVTDNSSGSNATGWRINGGPTRSSASSHLLSNNIAANNFHSHVPFGANGALYGVHDPRYGNFH